MWEQKGNNKKSHRAGAWRQMDHTLVDHALVARANFAVWPRKKNGQISISAAHLTNFPVWIPAERLLKKQKYLNRQSLLSERKSSAQARFENMQEN
jgi:hypothetical protein